MVKIAQLLGRGFKSVAAGRTQANLGLQSPHLPAAIVRLGRFAYTATGLWITACWYSGFVNVRTQPGSGPKLLIGGAKVGKVDRPDRQVPFGSAVNNSGDQAAGPTVSTNLPGSGKAGGFLPRGAPYTAHRQDQGRDGVTTPGGPIIAPGSGKVIHILSDPNGFGPDYPVVYFRDGPYAGKYLYIGHTHSALPVGKVFRKDDVLSHTGTHGVGNATVPGWFEIGYAPGGYPGRMGQPAPF